MTFEECLLHCAGSKELVEQFDRLTGSNLSMKGSPIELMVDRASGRTNAEIDAFVGFVHEFVWLPLIGGDGRNEQKEINPLSDMA